MPKVISSIDDKITAYEKELKALKKKKSDMEKKSLIKQATSIIKAMNKNADFANELKELCKKHNVSLETEAKKVSKK